MIACWKGHLTVVNILLQGSINIQAKNLEGFNAFMAACYEGHLSAVKSFLELPQGRFNVDETNEEGETGLAIAIRNENQDIVDAILQYKTDNSV